MLSAASSMYPVLCRMPHVACVYIYMCAFVCASMHVCVLTGEALAGLGGGAGGAGAGSLRRPDGLPPGSTGGIIIPRRRSGSQKARR